MKNFYKLLGIIALIAVIGFSMAACDNGSTGGGGGSAYLGENPTFSGQVYKRKRNFVDGTVKFEAYTEGNTTIGYPSAFTFTEIGTITDGQLNITLRTPDTVDLKVAGDFFDKDLDFTIFYGFDFTISSETTKLFLLDNIYSIPDKGYLMRGNFTGSYESSNTGEAVSFIYTDRDFTASAKKETITYTRDDVDPLDDFTYNWIGNACTLNFKKGWNAVYNKSQTSVSGKVKTYTETLSLANPNSLKWYF